MKYIKKFEKLFTEDLIPGNVYIDDKGTPICYIGYNKTEYPLTCMVLESDHQGKYYFMEWARFVLFYSKDTNMSLKEYIIDNNIVKKTMDALSRISFSSGGYGSNYSRTMVKKLRDELRNDPDISAFISAEKYNL